MKNRAKVIFHVDMNSFYASVEMTYNPSLKGKPVAIAGNPEERRGIIVTSSYEARAKGVKTTMPLWEAKKLCPELIVVRPHFDRYRDMSAKIFKRLLQFTNLVEPVSIDEGYLDVTDVDGDPIQLAVTIQNSILNELGIPCSIGIGPNKFLAKTASDMKKPLGITVLRKRELHTKLWPLPINKMYGVGNKTAEKLKSIDIHTIGDIAKADTYHLSLILGINGERLKNRANGIDPRIVDPDAVSDFKSIGNSQTLREDITNIDQIKSVLASLSEKVSERLQRRELKGQTIQIMIRYANRETITRSKKLSTYTFDYNDIFLHAFDLFDVHWSKDPVRLLGVTMQDIVEIKQIKHQLTLFTYEQEVKQHQMNETIQKLKQKYGDSIITSLKENSPSKKDDELLSTSFQKDFLDDFKNE